MVLLVNPNMPVVLAKPSLHCFVPFTVAKLCTSGVALLLLATCLAQGQLAPWVNLQRAPDGSNLVFQFTTQSNWFYTFMQSSNLSGWGYATNYYSRDTSLSWTNPVASNAAAAFFRVAVNPPNPTVVTNYHSWGNSISVNNGIVEVLIVPAAGRVQQFHFVGDTNGAFWENPTYYGQSASPTAAWKDFGGDKPWPAPQNCWSNGGWPPFDFDTQTNSVAITNGIVTLVRQVDGRFGIRATRSIQLLFNEPVMRVTTTFQRISNTTPSSLINSNLAVWIDCEVNVSTNSRVYIPVPSPSVFANGYTLTGDAFFGPSLPPSYTQANGLISFGPDTAASHKVGFDSGTLVLVGTNISLRVEAPRVSGATYTSGFNSAVYTAKYTSTSALVELEMLSPAPPLAVGESREFVTTYTLFHRTGVTTDAEAQKILAWHF